MSDGTVKIRLRSGSREIEIEASRTDVDELLTNWWSVSSVVADEALENEDSPSPSDQSASPSKSVTRSRRRTSTRRSASNGSSQSNGSSWDAHDLANRIKNDTRFEMIDRKIIHAPGDYYNKAAFVVSMSDEPLTSTQVQKVLLALRVKADLPRISEALSKNAKHFITAARPEGGKGNTYRLSQRAKTDIDKWLEDAGE